MKSPLFKTVMVSAALMGLMVAPQAQAIEESWSTIAYTAGKRISESKAKYDNSIRGLQASRVKLLGQTKRGKEKLEEARKAFNRCMARRVSTCMDELIRSSEESVVVAKFAAELLRMDMQLNKALATMASEVSQAVRDALESLQLDGGNPAVASSDEVRKGQERKVIDQLFTTHMLDDLSEEDLDDEGNPGENMKILLAGKLVDEIQSLTARKNAQGYTRANLAAELTELRMAAMGLRILGQQEAQLIEADRRNLQAIAVRNNFQIALDSLQSERGHMDDIVADAATDLRQRAEDRSNVIDDLTNKSSDKRRAGPGIAAKILKMQQNVRRRRLARVLVCGNGRVEAREECDDGNTVDGDGCSATCRR